MKNPAVSIIIPLYNAEKYIGELLDSILVQTFQDFEVIVVDDCSTDNSVAVAEGYKEKFDGRLKLTKTEKNSGSPGEPGNIGVVLSRGEYLLILDDDDAITPTALEDLYTVAKKFDADFVTCEKYYRIPDGIWHNAERRKKIHPTGYQWGGFVSEPTLVEINIAERIKECYSRRFLFPLWAKLIRRNFLIANDIQFTDNVIQDVLATYCMVYAAKRYVRVPTVINYYRVIGDSLSHVQDEPMQRSRRYIRAFIEGFNYLDKFLSRREYFQENMYMKYVALETYTRHALGNLNGMYSDFRMHQLDGIFREEFKDEGNAALLAFIFNCMNAYRLNQTRLYRNQLEEQRAEAFKNESLRLDHME